MSNTKPTIILIHGVLQNSLFTLPLAHRLRKLGFEVYQFNYPSTLKTLEDNSQKLYTFLIRKNLIHTPLVLIGHSLGALLIHKTLKNNQLANIHSVIAITPPFQGANIVTSLENKHLAFILGKALKNLKPQSYAWPYPIPLGIIVGTNSKGLVKIFLSNKKAKGRKRINDGILFLEETLPTNYFSQNNHNILSLHSPHTGILWHKELPKYCVSFICHQRFVLEDASSLG